MFPPKMLRVGLSVPVLLFAVMPNLSLASLQKVFPAANLGQMASGNACRYGGPRFANKVQEHVDTLIEEEEEHKSRAIT